MSNPYAALASVGLMMALGVTLDRCAPVIGANAQLAAAHKEVDRWKGEAATAETLRAGWEASFRRSEKLRVQEETEAVASITDAAAACDARVARAKASQAAIQSIVHKEPRHDPQGCPVRELVDPRQLRNALRPPDPG